MNQLVPVKRQSETIGIFGKRGCGKTMIMSYMGFLYYLNDYKIYSNYNLKYPHTYIDSLYDLQQIYKDDINKSKLGLFDDMERWFHSRSYMSKTSKSLNSILLDFGKINCSIMFTAKMSGLFNGEGKSVDVGLRQAVDEYWFPLIDSKYKTETKDQQKILDSYMNFKQMRIIRIDSSLAFLSDYKIMDLLPLCELYDTQQTITTLSL